MSAAQEVNTLGLIAGGGDLPNYLAQRCADLNIPIFIIGFEEHTDAALMNQHTHLWASMGQVGKIMSFFKDHNVSDLVMIGDVKRPSFKSLKPDMKGMKIISKIGLKAMGDNDLLSLLKAELEQEGFTLHGMRDFCDELLAPSGPIGKFDISDALKKYALYGLKISQQIGALDIGQSIIVQGGSVIAVEAAEGTDELIKRSAPLLKRGGGAILIKTCKPQQDKDLDMPTIGLETLERAHETGLDGIVIHAHNTLLVDAQMLAKRADDYKIFVVGMDI